MDDDFIKKRLARDMAELKKLCEEHFKQRFVSKLIPKFSYFFCYAKLWLLLKNNVLGVENRPQ